MKTKSLIAALLLIASSAFAQTTITDYDGNIYHPTVIGNQIWLKENLNTTHYRNGSPIQLLNGSVTNTQWGNTTSGAYDAFSGSYGKLYNYYAVANSNGVCPSGWHVPSNAEWNILFKFIDSNSDTVSTSGIVSTTAGGSLKDLISGLWNATNVGATNSTGFTALPGGFKDNFGNFANQRNVSFFWSTTTIALPIFNYFVYQSYATSLYSNSTNIAKYYWEKNYGLSIRCISDTLACASAPTGSITSDGPTTFCAGNSVTLNAPNILGVNYQWKKNGVNITSNGNSRSYKATSTGSYSCLMTNACGFNITNSISITTKTNAFASVTASGATSFCLGDSVTLNATNLGSNYSVQWYRTNISMENATNYSQVVKQPGTYKVVTRNLTNGCSRISGSSVVVAVNCRLANPDVIAADITESDFDAATREAEPKGKIYIYPNPTSDNKFTVELMGLELNGDATLEVYNAMGQILSSEKVNITNGTLNRTIQIDEQSKGQLCIVRLIIGSEVYDSKVILK